MQITGGPDQNFQDQSRPQTPPSYVSDRPARASRHNICHVTDIIADNEFSGSCKLSRVDFSSL